MVIFPRLPSYTNLLCFSLAKSSTILIYLDFWLHSPSQTPSPILGSAGAGGLGASYEAGGFDILCNIPPQSDMVCII